MMMKTTTTKTAQFFLDDETVARITFKLDSNNQASFSGAIYQLTNYSLDEMKANYLDDIKNNVIFYADELEHQSMEDFAESRLETETDYIIDSCEYMDIDSTIATPDMSDKGFTGFSLVSLGNLCYKDIEKYNFNKLDIFKALEKEWQALHLSTITDTQATRIINLMTLLDDTESDEKAQNLIDNF